MFTFIQKGAFVRMCVVLIIFPICTFTHLHILSGYLAFCIDALRQYKKPNSQRGISFSRPTSVLYLT